MMATNISAAIRMMTIAQVVSNVQKKKNEVIKKGERLESSLTNPLQLLAMPMTQQILQNSQQIGNDVEPIIQQADALVHLEVAPDGLVHGFELGLDPEDLGGVEDGAVEVDVDAQGEELADLHVDLGAGEGDFAREGDLVGDFFAGFDCGCYELFEEGGLVHAQVVFSLANFFLGRSRYMLKG